MNYNNNFVVREPTEQIIMPDSLVVKLVKNHKFEITIIYNVDFIIQMCSVHSCSFIDYGIWIQFSPSIDEHQVIVGG